MAVQMQSSQEGLQQLLETLSPGDRIRPTKASRMTGLDPETCETVLEALVRVGLFTRRTDGVFVRCQLFEFIDRLQS